MKSGRNRNKDQAADAAAVSVPWVEPSTERVANPTGKGASMNHIVDFGANSVFSHPHCAVTPIREAARNPQHSPVRRLRSLRESIREIHPATPAPVYPIGLANGASPAGAPREGAALTKGQATPGRLLFYSHDTFGLGHIRRTQAICQAVTGALDSSAALILTGSSAVQGLKLPEGVDYVKLPSVTKVGNEAYESKFLRVEFDAIRQLREQLILSSVAAFQPDVVFVDNVPLGMKKELLPALEYLRSLPQRPRMILTLRDILDEPERIVKQWTENGVYEAIDRYYDEVVIYGLPEVYDFVKEYQIPAYLARKVSYAGYIDRVADPVKTAEMRRRYAPNGEKLALCTVGGGGDGQELVETYLAGLDAREAGSSLRNVVVFGPDMPEAVRSTLRQRYGHRTDLVMMDFCPEMTACIAAADVVVSMGGYNTVSEILALRKKAVLVPRVAPRLEQWIRCHRLDQMGLARCLHPDDATPQNLWHAIDALLGARSASRRDAVTFDGLRFVIDLVRGALAAPLTAAARSGQGDGAATLVAVPA